MSDLLIKCEVTMGKDKSTRVHGETIEEILGKLRDFHTMCGVEREYFTKRGELDKELASGWYLKEKNT